MKIEQIKKILDKKHISDFTLEELFTKLGVYEECIIDVQAIEEIKDKIFIEYFVSKDVKKLFELIHESRNIELPCNKCSNIEVFRNFNSDYINFYAMNGEKNKIYNDYVNDKLSKYEYMLNDDKKVFEINNFLNEKISCILRERYSSYNIIKSKNKYIKEFIKYIINRYSEIRRDFECCLDNTHYIVANFIIKPAITENVIPEELIDYEKRLDDAISKGIELPKMTEKEKEIYDMYKHVSSLLIIEKIGQYPSMVDMQLFETEKYRKLLKNDYKDLSMALGLYASGVGCGSFVYLRRILEKLVEEEHNKIKGVPDWDEEKYKNKRFNEKLDYLSSFDIKIIPDELKEVKSKIYGVISKGIHESTDDECKEIFPYLQVAIELILDKKLAELEKSEKIKQLTIKINEKC